MRLCFSQVSTLGAMKTVIPGGVSRRSSLLSFLPSFAARGGFGISIFTVSCSAYHFSEKIIFLQLRSMMQIMLLGIRNLRCDENADYRKEFDKRVLFTII